MPDFDGFERALRHFLVTDSTASPREVATEIFELGDGNLPNHKEFTRRLKGPATLFAHHRDPASS